MVKSDSYILEVGKSGSERLDEQHKLYATSSKGFLLRAGLKEGMQTLEVGSGTGSMSYWISQAIGSSCRHKAIDISQEQIDFARERAEGDCIEFEVWDILKQKDAWIGKFDLIYCRFLLGHLREPTKALGHMVSYLRRGGIIACEESTGLNSCFSSPVSGALEKMIALYLNCQRAKGTRSLGIDIYHHLKKLGLQTVDANLFQPLLVSPSQKKLVTMAFQEFSPFAINANLISAEEAKSLEDQLGILEMDDSVIGYIRVAQVFGRRT